MATDGVPILLLLPKHLRWVIVDHGACRYFTARFPRLLLTTYKFAEQHCSTDPPLQDYFPHVPLQAGLLPLPLPLAMPSPSVQQALEDSSEKHLPSAPARPSPFMSTQPTSKALVSASDASMGATVNDGLVADRVGATAAVPNVQSWGLLFPHPLPPAPWTEQHSCAATSTGAAHEQRRTWWPRQGSGLPDASSSREHIATGQLLVSPLHHDGDVSKPPGEALGTAPTALCDDESDHDQVLERQQADDSNRCSKRPAAVSAAWAVHRQATSFVNHTTQQCLQKRQELVLEGEDGAPQLLEDSAWPPLVANTPQQQKQTSQQEQHGQGQGQGELRGSLPQKHLPGEHTDKPQAEAYRKSQRCQHHEQAQQQQPQQQQPHCSPDIAADRQHDCLSASCLRPHADESWSNPTRSQDAAMLVNLVPVSEPSEAHIHAAGSFPQRPGQTLCEFYVRTGFCKFGQGCKFDHPVQFAVCLNGLGLPLRHQEATCPFYAKTGVCKFGPSCKFDHPEVV